MLGFSWEDQKTILSNCYVVDEFYPVRKVKILQLSFSTKINPLEDINPLDKQAVSIGAENKKNPFAGNEWIFRRFLWLIKPKFLSR
jgi:hypothetical protein